MCACESVKFIYEEKQIEGCRCGVASEPQEDKNMVSFRDMEFEERKAVIDRLSEVMEKEFSIPKQDVDDFWGLIILAGKVLVLSVKLGDPAGAGLIKTLENMVKEKLGMC